MHYKQEELDEIAKDPVRLRCYFWNTAQKWRLMAARKQSLDGERPEILAWSANNVLENMDSFIQSALDGTMILVSSENGQSIKRR